MNVIVITGTPGTGKTVLAKKIAEKLNYYYVDVNGIIRKYDLGKNYDKKRTTKIIDIKNLNKALIREISNIKKNNKAKSKNNIKKLKNNKIKSGIIVDSHFSHYLPKKHVDLCIVTKCDLKKLESRLKKRKYSQSKIRENLDAEIFDVCLNEAKENGHKIMVVDTTKRVDIKNITDKIKVK